MALWGLCDEPSEQVGRHLVPAPVLDVPHLARESAVHPSHQLPDTGGRVPGHELLSLGEVVDLTRLVSSDHGFLEDGLNFLFTSSQGKD